MFCSGRKWVAEATICTKLMKREKRRMGKRRAKKAKREKKKRRERRRNEKRGNQMKRMYERKKYETVLCFEKFRSTDNTSAVMRPSLYSRIDL
ncbi:PPM1A isoform 2 [Pongo abelii]|uniref:PPM1A isoform 2 n=1 Tax=Pongo abelii TaxID=9601 RepID=A0A2J8WLH4_PONAB|nr:PPM1A isoform 2 [Pongo abelii]